MSDSFKARQISPHVYWVGAVDWTVRNFHGYRTGRGTTYNAYLVNADKITLIDTVKPAFRDEMLARISSVVDPREIDYLVSNHSEMDHSGSIPQACHILKPEKVFASKMGQKALADHFHMDRDITVVGDGDTLDMGGMNLAFAETRMCHWPDSMVSYLDTDRVLFSQDAFGMHLASHERFADEIDRNILDSEAAKYFANILLHLSNFIVKALDKLAALNLPLNMVAPDHGPIWRNEDDIKGIIDRYSRWTQQVPTKKAVVVYDTMWQSTAAMARVIGEGLADGGAESKIMCLGASHRSDVVTELLEAGALLVGSPTINNNVFPTVADVMTYIKGLRPANLVAAAFGSYGWSGEAPRHIHAMLQEMELDVIDQPLPVKYVPDGQALADCRNLGLKTARTVLENAKGEDQ